MEKISRKHFAARLFLIGLFGVFSLLLSDLQNVIELPREITSRFSSTQIQFLLLINPLILLSVSVLLGSLLYRKVGLDAPILSSKFEPQKTQALFRDILRLGVVTGIVVGIALIVIFVVGKSAISSDAVNSPANSSLNLVTRLMYGGITEEIIMRFGLMTFLVWIFARLLNSRPDVVFVFAIVISSLLFAIGHLPLVYSTIEVVSLGLVAYILIANSVAGLVYGYLYWKKGLECSMISHATTHVTLIAAL